jgi:uncharacterized membrane protein YcaP (DUF421 family)
MLPPFALQKCGTGHWKAGIGMSHLIGFRLGERRTLAEMSPFDFVAAVAVGAIVGSVPNSKDTSYLAGAATLVTVFIAHRVIMRLRHFPSVAHLVEHSPRVLVDNKDPRRRVRASHKTAELH